MPLHQELSVFGAVATLWVVATILPGLDFLMVARLAMTRGRIPALFAAFGVSIGVALWGLAGFFGISFLFAASPWLFFLLRIAGGGYLLWLGIKLIIASCKPAPASPSLPAKLTHSKHAFRTGLLTNLANPKAPIFVSSLFAATLPQHAPTSLGLGCVSIMFVIALIWFPMVALLFSHRYFSDFLTRNAKYIDRIAGVAFALLGIRMATES